MKCINCNTELSEGYQFCPSCGQKVGVKRITFREGWNDFWARIYGFDGMFPRTLRDLTIRPGEAARIYIGGNRVTYYGPVGYFFLMITLLLIVIQMIGVDMYQFLGRYSSTLQTTTEGSGQAQAFRIMMNFVASNLRWISFLGVPLMAVGARYILFRKELNFVEHLVLPFYLLGHFYWMAIVSVVLLAIWSNPVPSWITVPVSMFYFGWGYQGLIKKPWSFIKGVGVYLTGQLLIGLVGVLVFVIALALNPELLELIRPSNNP